MDTTLFEFKHQIHKHLLRVTNHRSLTRDLLQKATLAFRMHLANFVKFPAPRKPEDGAFFGKPEQKRLSLLQLTKLRNIRQQLQLAGDIDVVYSSYSGLYLQTHCVKLGSYIQIDD